MIRRIGMAVALALLAMPAWAADNAMTLTPGAGVTERSKDVGAGVQSLIIIPGDTSGNALATAPGSGNSSFALPMQGVVGGIAVPISAATLPLPTGAATQTTLASILSALGTPFQAGGSIGNTSFAATQSGTWNITNISGTISLPTGAATSANQQTNAAVGSTSSGQTGIVGMGFVTTGAPTYTTAQTNPLSLDTAGNLRVNCITGCSGGGGGGAITAASGSYASGAFSAGAGTDGWDVTQGLTTQSACSGDATSGCSVEQRLQRIAQNLTTVNTNLTAAVPYFTATAWSTNTYTNGTNNPGNGDLHGAAWIDLGAVDGTALGAPSNYGTSPGAVSVIGVNAFVTNAVSVSPSANGTWALMSGTTPGTAPTNTLIAGGIYNSSAPTPTTGQTLPFQLDSAGRLIVNVGSGGGTGGTSSTFGATFPGTGTAGGMSQGGNMVAMTGTSGNLNVQCANCSGSGVTNTDEGAFTAGSSLFVSTGGVYQTSSTSNPLTNGQVGVAQVTANRAVHANLRNASGTEIGTATTPIVTNQTQVAGSTIVADPCQQVIKSTAAISQAGSGTIISGTSAKSTYVCSYLFNIADAESVSITEGTGSTCGTGTPFALLGSTTVANGSALAANEGMSQGNGGYTVISANHTTADNVCILQSGSGRVSGTVSYVQL